MRRSHLAVFATVSLSALVSVATTSQAVQTPGIIMGVLKPVDSWKVGTVNVTGASFCAMVNKYDNGVGLAFARSPEGYGTVAMDLHQDILTRDTSYEVQLKIDGGPARKLEGKATSTRSLVVQIGGDKDIYDALSHNGTMEISMPLADVSFSLAKFSNSFKNLLNCSDKLSGKAASAKNDGPKMAAVKVQDVEQDSLAPIDREVQKLNKGDQAAAPEAQNSLDAQLDDAANAEVKQSETNIAKLDQQKQDVAQKIDYGRHEVAQLEDQKQQVERKLIASVRSETPPVPPANTGAVAKLWDDQQAKAAAERLEDQAKADSLNVQVAAHDAQIATIEATKAQAATDQVEQSAANQKALDQKTAKLEKQRDDLAAKQAANTGNKAIRAALVAKEAQLADADAKRAAERDQLTQKLAVTQASFSDQIAALQSERDSLKQQLVAARAEAAQWQDADMADRAQAKDLQTRLSQADEARHGLEARVAELSDARQKTLASASSAQTKELADAKAELASVKTEDAKKLSDLQEKLSDKTAQFDAIKAQYASLQQEGSAKVASTSAGLAKEHQALADQVAQKQAEIDRLQNKLAQIEADRATEASKARTAQADLADTRQQLSGMRKSLVVINDNEVAGSALNDIRPAAGGDSDELKKAKDELASLRQKNAELSEQLALEATKPEVAPATEAGKQAQAELASLRQKNADLSKQLADAAQAAQQKSPDVEKAQAELADLRAKNAELTSRLASASQTAPHATPELAEAEEELADLRAKNAELSSRVASSGDQPAKSEELAEAKTELDSLRAQNADLTAKLAARPAADDGKAQAELADLRQKNAELSDKLAAAAKPGAGLDKTQGELADLRAKNAQLEQRLITIVNSEPQPLPTAKAVVGDSAAREQIMSAAAEIARLRATKASLEQQLALRQMGAPVPAPAAPEAAPAPEAQSLAQLKPSSGDTVAPVAAAPAAPSTPATSTASEDPLAPHAAAANLDRSSWWTAANAAAKATTDKVADAAAAAPAADPSFDSNRAAAFLDRIMAYHRPAGSPAARHPSALPEVADATPVFGGVTHAEASAPVPPPAAPRHSAQPHPRVQPAIAAAKPAPVRADHGMTEMPDDADLAAAPAPVTQGKRLDIASEPIRSEPLAAPAAHVETASAMHAPVIRSTTELPRLAAAPIAHMSGANPTTLENLLSSAGVDAKFKPADGNTRQWVSGSVNGMYEQLPAGDFTAQAQSYIERYREDCPGGLTINMGQPQTTGAGTFAVANVSCSLTSNSYNTSFVFVQDAKKFSAILHTGYPEDASKVRSIGDNVAYTLGASGGLMAPSSPRKAEADIPASPVPAAVDSSPAPRHLNVPATQPVSASGSAHFGARSDDGLDTVVVQ